MITHVQFSILVRHHDFKENCTCLPQVGYYKLNFVEYLMYLHRERPIRNTICTLDSYMYMFYQYDQYLCVFNVVL